MESRKGKDQRSGGAWKSLRSIYEFPIAHRKFFLGAGLALLAIAVYFPAIDSLMVADDFLIVGRWGFDDAVRSLHDTVGFGRNEYRPVIAFSYAVSKWLWRGDPRGYHLDSILLHAAAAILFFGWLLMLTRSAAVSGIAAALFAVHPINVERVAWITARDSLFSTVFSLLALTTYTLARRKDESPSPSSRMIPLFFSNVFFILSLLSYEGAAVVPILMAAMEFFIFAKPKQGFWRRALSAASRTRWHMLSLFIYLIWWALLFQGKVGLYYLSYSAGGIIHNYYSYLYHLFHGNSRLAGILYFLLLVSLFFLPRERRPLAIFSFAFMLIAYVPFIFIPGFADRFAYAGAVGYALFIALLMHARLQLKTDAGPSQRFVGKTPALIFFAILASYYIISSRARISDWVAAGQIAESIPRQVKALYPDLPDATRLVLGNIPAMHGHAYVYPVGLDFSIARFYPGRSLQVIYGQGELGKIIKENVQGGNNCLYFNYLSDRREIREFGRN